MKIIVSDFDYTFFDDDFEQNIERINKFVDDGNLFVIATSRNITSLNEDIDFYNIKYSYLICKDGGMIFDKNMHVIYQKNIDSDIINEVFEALDTAGATSETWIDNGTDFVLDVDDGCNSLISKIADRKKCCELLQYIKNKYSNIDGYISEYWINIHDVSVNKANGIEILLNKLNWNKDNIYTIGGDSNDILMVERYHGYATDNSCDEVKNSAIVIADNFIDAVDLIQNND